MKRITKLFLFFSVCLTSLSIYANALSAIVGLGTVWFVIPILFNFFSSLLQNISNVFHDIIIFLLAVGIPVIVFWIGIALDTYIIRTCMPSASNSRYIALVSNIIVAVMAAIIFTLPIFASIFPSLDIVFTWSLLLYPLIWLAIDIVVYTITLRFVASIHSRTFFYRLILIDLVPIIIFSVIIWFPFLLLLVQKF